MVRLITTITKYTGLSTDTKPAAQVGSLFLETDTSLLFIYDGANWIFTREVKF